MTEESFYRTDMIIPSFTLLAAIILFIINLSYSSYSVECPPGFLECCSSGECKPEKHCYYIYITCFNPTTYKEVSPVYNRVWSQAFIFGEGRTPPYLLSSLFFFVTSLGLGIIVIIWRRIKLRRGEELALLEKT